MPEVDAEIAATLQEMEEAYRKVLNALAESRITYKELYLSLPLLLTQLFRRKDDVEGWIKVRALVDMLLGIKGPDYIG
jgi:hypothetical protein